MLAPPSVPGVSEDEAKKRTLRWPMFKWSGDERYFARVTPGQQISIYQTPSMGLLDKKSVKLEGVVDFEWAPMGDKDREHDAAVESGKRKDQRESALAYWVPEIGNQPARVTLMSVPSRATLRSKNLFNVSEVRWSTCSLQTCLTQRTVQNLLAVSRRLFVHQSRSAYAIKEDDLHQPRSLPITRQGVSSRDDRGQRCRHRLCMGAKRRSLCYADVERSDAGSDWSRRDDQVESQLLSARCEEG